MEKTPKDNQVVAPGSSRMRWNVAVWAVVFVYFCFILTISLSYNWGYLSTLTDMGTFDQAIWATLNGSPSVHMQQAAAHRWFKIDF